LHTLQRNFGHRNNSEILGFFAVLFDSFVVSSCTLIKVRNEKAL